MTPLARLTAAIDELVEPRTHTERFTRDTGHGPITHHWQTHVASLLDQLRQAVTPGSSIDLDNGHAIPASRPTASIEALDTLEAITVEVTRLITYTGPRPRPDLEANLRGLLGTAASSDDDTQTYLAGLAERWLSRAKVLTGWEIPPWKPANSCPLCDARHSLRVRGITDIEVHACCVACGETWTPTTIGLLAEHMRWENGELDTPDSGAA